MGIKKNVYFTTLRIKDWLHVLGLTILGIGYYDTAKLLSKESIIGLLISSLLLAHIYSLNTCLDATVEPYWNKALTLLDNNFFKKILLFSYFIFIVNFIISYFYFPPILYLIIASNLLCLIYSVPHLRLKRNSLFNYLINSSGASILFIIGFASVSKTININSIIMAIFFGLIFMPLQIIHNLSHYSVEEKKESMSSRIMRTRTVELHFNFSLLLIILWSLILCKIIDDKYIYLFYPTCMLVLLFFYFMRKLRISAEINVSMAAKTRLIFRKICVGYGITIFFIYRLLK